MDETKPMSDARFKALYAKLHEPGEVDMGFSRLVAGEMIREIDRLRTEHQAEVDEFNAGYNASVAGLPDEEPSDTKYDQWRVGYAWASFDRLRAIEEAFQRSPYDISPCHECGEPTVCLPDGLPFCEACGEKDQDNG